MKNKRITTYALVAALLGVIVGAVWFWIFRGIGPAPAPQASVCETDPALIERLEELAADQGETRQELNAVRLQVAELNDFMEYMQAAQSSDIALRSSLPPPYVSMVDSFFESDSAKTLLAADAQKRRGIKFEKPRFVSRDVISVPYTAGGKDYHMLVTIIVLDFYDLRFDVLWDSMEAEIRR